MVLLGSPALPEELRRLRHREHRRQVIQQLAREALQFEQVDEVLFVHAGKMSVRPGGVSTHFCHVHREIAGDSPDTRRRRAVNARCRYTRRVTGGRRVTDTPTERAAESIWTRLRRRKVVQWGLVYVAAAWGFLQGLEYLSGTYDWPRQIQQYTTLILLIGLPIGLVLAWYHGDRGQQRIATPELAILMVLLLLGGGAFWYYQRASEAPKDAVSPSPTAAATATDRSIAVLPFVNMSADKEQEYFADGISEELLNLLAQVPELRVIARTSSFSFKGKEVDIAEIARKLNVANVLEGSVRKSGDTLRITAQLVRASDSSHLWSQTYDRQMTDVFKVQDEIAADVVAQLKIKLLDSAPKLRVTDPQAYVLFLQGREVARQFSAAALDQAIALYKQVLAIDPTYAPAWDGLADAYYNQIDLSSISIDQLLPLAKEAVNRGLANDPGYAPVYARAALVEGALEGDLAAAAQRLEQGFALDPANFDLIGSATVIARRLGRLEQAIALGEYLVARDPINERGHDQLALAYLHAGRLDEALAGFRTVLRLAPEFSSEHSYIGRVLMLKGEAKAALTEVQQEPAESWRLIGLSMAYHALGQKAESDAALDELISKYGQIMVYEIAEVLAYRGEADRAFKWLDRAAKFLGAIAVDPMLENLHSDPRWLPLLRRFGMAPEQLATIKFDVNVPN
jgi:TolB-like protein